MLKVKVEPVDPSLRAEVQIQPEEQENNLEPVTIAGYQVYCNEDQNQKLGENEENEEDEGQSSAPSQELTDNTHQVEDGNGEQTVDPVVAADLESPSQAEDSHQVMEPQPDQDINLDETMQIPATEQVSSENDSGMGKMPPAEDATLPVLEIAPTEEIGSFSTDNKSEEQEIVLEEGVVVETTTEGEEIVTEEMPQVIVEEGIQEEEVNMSGVMEVPYVPDQNPGETVYVFEEGVEYVVEEGAGEEYIMDGSAKVEGAEGEHIVAIINEGEEGEQRVLLQRQEDGNHVIVESLPYEMADYSQFNLPSSNRSSPRQVIGGDGIAVQEDIEVSTEDSIPTVDTNDKIEPDPKSVKKAKKKKVPTATLR